MTTVGIGSASFSNNNPRNSRGKKRKQLLARRSLLESLEARHLMAAGPQLIGVQPNEGSLISLGTTGANATILNASPREIVLRFDDNTALDFNTLSGIQIKRSGADGILESAYLTTDLGTNGQVVLDFSAALPGQQGNGLELKFTQVSRSFGTPGKPISWPTLSVVGNRINIEVNTQTGNKTTAADLIRAMTEDPVVASKVLVKRLRGVESTVIADTLPANQVLTLLGADSSRASSNLNSGNNSLQVEFLSVRAGITGKIEFVSRDFGGQAIPVVSVQGQTVHVEVNSNSRFLSTAQEVIDAINQSPEARLVLQARLVSGSASARIGSNFPTLTQLNLVSGDDVAITPAYIGQGDTDREVVIRFAETLPDDSYLIDILGTGVFALRNAAGLPFNDGVSQSVRFDLDLGTNIQAVVPQPIVRGSDGKLTQLQNQIYVYFNNDDLNPVEAVKTAFYQLVYTANTSTGRDDIVFQPSSVSYDATLNRVALTFNRTLDTFVDPSTSLPLPISTMRLRIGNSQLPSTDAVTTFKPATDPGSRFDTATDLGSAWLSGSGAKAAIVSSEIRNSTSDAPAPYPLDFPGANDEQGNRDNVYQHHVTGTDKDGIAVIPYNFAAQLGQANGSVQFNAITDTQKGMVRQVLSLYERYLGVRFTESDNLGITIAVGDMQAILETADTVVETNAPGGRSYAAGQLRSNPSVSAVVVDIQDFNSEAQNQFGTELFRTFMRGIGVLLGLGNADELPQATVQSNIVDNDPNIERVFPGNADIIHGQFVLRPEGKDIDLYKFTVPTNGGRLQLQVAAERLANSSLLDASLRLYRNEASPTEPKRWVEIAANEDYFSDDPRISLDSVSAGEYIVGVSAKGNTTYDPNIEDSGLGGKSEGVYDLRIDFRPPATSTLVDANGLPTPLDGDGDGRPGGVFNYWFVPTRPDRLASSQSAYTVWVDKAAGFTTSGSPIVGYVGNGTLAAPYATISRALQDAKLAASNDPTGKRAVTVRIVGNTQNRAYEIGFNRFGTELADGQSFDVPKNVTVMIDAGAIIKMGRSRISAGSSTVSVDRSGGTLQLLGIPDTKVIVTSINDTVGIGSNPDRTPPAPAAGDWGGIDFRNRIDGSDETRTDKERQGLFLNTVIHSDIRFGGGQVVVDGVSQIIAPINMIDSRPSIYNNLITRSADAAMSATPNSFKEDDFADPRTQGSVNAVPSTLFAPDYDRVGPDIHGNRVVNNSINGLFIKTQTDVAGTLETITVTARFDDVDITHIIGENLIVAGTAGGGIVDVASPPTTVVVLSSVAGGSLAAGTYNYRLVYVDAAGNESLASIPTSSLTVVANSSITLNNLPAISSNLPYVARRLYRSDSTGGGSYRLVSQLNAIATTFTDNGTLTGTALIPLDFKIRSRLDGGLVLDPGLVLKNRGSRIEVKDGGTLIAEGKDGLPIVMTSIYDSTYGFGGTFDTANLQGTRSADKGDWGGIFVGQGSSASLDYNRISYGGGTTRIEGDFASFNAIEVHQADFRLSNSRLFNNESGTESSNGSTRLGRGTNSPATIFVRGSQPIIVNNRINDNLAAAISIDVNSLGPDLQNDRGRQSGLIGRGLDYVENTGPLVDGNRLSRNGINGMVVRGQTLTTESIWDDTDIVHVVEDVITSDNFHTYGGLRLKSSPSESLVVKFGGSTNLAGLNATGTPSDFASRIGGSIQVIGQPNFPVIMTALADDSVGAGFGIDGRAAFDTDNNQTGNSSTSVIRLPFGPEVDRGTLIDNDVDVNLPGFFSAQPSPGGNLSFRNSSSSGITAQGANTLFTNENVIFDFTNYIDLGANGNGIDLSTTTITQQPTLVGPDLVVSAGTFLGNNNVVVRWRVETRFDNGVSKMFNTIQLDSDQPLGPIKFINYLDEDIQSPTDDFLYVTGTPGQSDFRAFTIDSVERVGFSHGGVYEAGQDLQNATYTGWAADQYSALQTDIQNNGTTYTPAGNINLTNLPSTTDPTLGQIYGLGDVTTAFAWAVDPNANSARITSFLELVPQSIQRVASAGSWNGVSLQTYSNDRNVGVVSESESARATAPSSNDSPSTSQYLGQLAKQSSSGDENARLGFEIQGTLNKSSDVDVYSFTANGRTEVWLDIDRTTSSLDTVVELISADGTILALSNDSYLEETNPLANPLYSTLLGNSVSTLRKSSLTQLPLSTRGEARDDYSTNPKDAGMRVFLPGQENQATLYHIRVRSSNQFPGQPANTPALSDPASVGQGRSHGSYQLQVRLGEAQEIPGSSFSYADVRYATNGITLAGVPRHSPLLGENAEVAARANDSFATAQPLGNILTTDRRTISVAGELSSNTDVDWYSFSIEYDSLVSPLAKYLSTIFDVDYADGIGRADMAMYLFDSTGTLIHFGENSNILDDRVTGLSGAGNTDLGRGSSGTLDPFLGSIELLHGQYFLALTNRTMVPTVLANRLDPNATPSDNLTRIQPINSGRYIVEDHVETTGGSTFGTPITPNFMPAGSQIDYTLGDVALYFNRGPVSGTQISITNPFTGELSNEIGSTGMDLRDIAIRPNGDIRSFRSLTGAPSSVPTPNPARDLWSSYVNVDPATGATSIGGVGFGFNNTTSQLVLTGNPLKAVITDQNVGFDIEALTFMENRSENKGFLIANRSNGAGVQYRQNILYRFDPSTGEGISFPANDGDNFIRPTVGDEVILGAGTNKTERGWIDTSVELSAPGPRPNITGLAGIGGDLYAVSDGGGLYVISSAELNSNVTHAIGTYLGQVGGAGRTLAFTGLTAGPQRVENGQYSRILFGTTSNGQMFAFNVDGVLQNVFSLNRSSVPTGNGAANGLTFSNLDFNLWHQTDNRGADAGHSRTDSWYFGFEGDSVSSLDTQASSARFNNEPLRDTYNFPGGALGVLESRPISLKGITAADAPKLYFDYFLDTDSGVSQILQNTFMSDSFRVYGIDDNDANGYWTLLTTNNASESAVEPTSDNNHNSAAPGAIGWRQARVDLSAFAGSSDVRLRFEFNTAGSMRYGTVGGRGLELRTVAASELQDGNTFTISGKRFEIDMGYSLIVPAGATISNNDSFNFSGVPSVNGVDGVNFVFWDGTGTSPVVSNSNRVIRFNATDSAETVTQSVFAALASQFPPQSGAAQVLSVGNRIQFVPPTSVVTLLPLNSALTLQGRPGVTAGNVAVDVELTMNATQVARQVSIAMENSLGGGVTYTTFNQESRYVELQGVTVTDAGPFKVSTLRDEDRLSGNGVNRARNNKFEGLYLDDFIIGLAERGESVFGARADTSFVSVASAGSEILSGTYQLEIRGGTEYGQPLRGDTGIVLTKAFEPNQQESRSQSIRFNDASKLSDGLTLKLSDGVSSVTLEFEDQSLSATSPAKGVRPGNFAVPFNYGIGESGYVIATRVRDLINSAGIQSVLNIVAISADSSTTSNNVSDVISLAGTITADIPAAVGSNLGVLTSSNFTGDRNTPREQGQVVIENSRITNSSEYGITLKSDVRDAVSNAPNPGAARNTIALNGQRLAPGAVVINNELVGNVLGGIRVEGDTVPGNVPPASVPFARIINNSILGGSVSNFTATASATFGDDFYSAGSISFADAVTRYDATAGGGPVPLVGLQTPNEALGAPNYSGIGEPTPGQGVVSLGRGGVLVVQFTNNILTGSDDGLPDLAVYEVGSSEQARVEVSSDGVTYTSVGVVSFNNRYVDLDAFGFNSLSQLYFVRITDVPNEGATSGDSVGADIDAVGALSSRPAQRYSPGGIGIDVRGNASPTLLNNIVANHATGISVSASSSSTVIGGTLYQGNTLSSTGSTGLFPIVIGNGVPLFTNAVTGNLYPVPGSKAIDSSIDSLVDRASLLTVKQPLGLAPSPIIAPTDDIHGLLRSDDPTVVSPPGLGEGIFKDRGASERADFVGPIPVALNPFDNDTQGRDSNPALGTIELVSSTLSYFDIQVLDTSQIGNKSQGSGVNQLSVSPNSVLVSKNGVELVEGLNYRFGFDSTSGIVRLTPLEGVWASDAVYQIRFINTNESAIQLADPKDIVDGTIYSINTSTSTTQFELETGLRLQVPTSISGFTNQAVDGTIFRVDDGFRRVTYELDNNSTVRQGNVQIPFSSQDPPQVLAERIAVAIRASALSLTVKSIGGSELQILGSSLIRVVPEDSGIVVRGRAGTTPTYGLQIPTANGLPVGVTDGQKFTIQRGNTTNVFELDNNGTVGTNNIRVPLNIASTDSVAAGIVSAINGANMGLTATASPGGLISIGTQPDLRIQATSTVLQVVGTPGRPATVAVPIDLAQVLTASQAATLLLNAIAANNLPNVQLTQLDSRVFVEGARGISGLGSFSVSGIRDVAGNAMRATENNGQTIVNIFLGEGLDYGDAADPIYASKKASNGARHTIVPGFSLGPTVTADPDARVVDLDTDDGVTVDPFTASFTGSITVDVHGALPSRNAFVSAWIDLNGNGVFESTEKIAEKQYFSDGQYKITMDSVSSDARTDIPVAIRVRMSSQQGLGPVGLAPDGEVEDYYTTVQNNPYRNATNALDVNGDGSVSPIDVLQLVNYINFNGSSTKLPFPNGLAVPPYLDVNGDGFVGPLDVITVINYINSKTSGGGAEGEGSSASSQWISATAAAPAIATGENKKSTCTSLENESNAITAVDDYLSQVAVNVGPALATDELEWSSVMPTAEVVKEKDSDLALSLAIDDLLSEFA